MGTKKEQPKVIPLPAVRNTYDAKSAHGENYVGRQIRAARKARGLTIPALAEKLENCCKYIANEKAAIEGLKAEEDRIKARRQAKENAVDRLKKLMADAMNMAGEKKLPCGTFTCSIQANPPKTVIDVSLADIPTKYLIPQLPKVDTKALAADLKNPETADGLASIAHLEQGESLRIR